MPERDFETICMDALKLWGLESQLDQMAEECAEYIAALNRYKRGRIGMGELLEEMGDVSIMSDEMQVFFKLEPYMQAKINRLEKLLYGEPKTLEGRG